MLSPRFVISGHATSDYVVRLETPFGGSGTVPAKLGQGDGWSRPGGATFYAAARLANAGIEAAPVSWLGEDGDGDRYIGACAASGIYVAGLDRDASRQTVRCLMIYQPDGQTACIIDEGGPAAVSLSAQQRALVAAASHVVISAGPPSATAEVLKACSKDASVSWIVKDDPRAFPPDLSARIAARADVIFCNADEMPLVTQTLRSYTFGNRRIIETRGHRGAVLHYRGDQTIIPAPRVNPSDTTGAGDSLAGEILALTATSSGAWENAISIAVSHVAKWLADR